MPFADVLTAERLEQALREEKASWREAIYTPALTLWAFLSQIVSPDGSCRAAVARVLAWLVSRGEEPCSPKTDPYCKARQRLPESLLHRLVCETGQELHRRSQADWLWKGRRVKIADGTTVSMPDTPANQAAYPQHNAQAAGVGFPIARLVVVFGLACGTVLEAALGRYQGKQTGENALLRTVADAFEPGDVLLADRYFGGWFDLAFWQQRGVEVVVRLHQLRRCDLRRGRRLGPNEHVVAWPKPARPDWMNTATYQALPEELELREVRVRVRQKGFRTEVFVVVTTLLDAPTYTAADLADLYRLRWHAELEREQANATWLGLPAALARGTGSAVVESDLGNGRAALPVAGDGPQGSMGAFPGLQPDPRRHGAGGPGGGGGPAGAELHRGAASADRVRGAVAGSGGGGAGGVVCVAVIDHRGAPSRRPPRPGGAAGAQAPAQDVPATDQAPRGSPKEAPAQALGSQEVPFVSDTFSLDDCCGVRRRSLATALTRRTGAGRCRSRSAAARARRRGAGQ